MKKLKKNLRILTGIQSTGITHLGNLFGAILPAISMANISLTPSFIFIADLHSITQIKNSELLNLNTYKVAAVCLACGLPVEKAIFYKQSDVPEVTELTWYLNCFFSYQRLTLSHSFKDKLNFLKNINVGLFTYPLLMAADILLYDAEIVPVGKDQLQHLEFTRNVARHFNYKMGKIFVIPEAKLTEHFMSIPGTDGKKMSKSRGNIIDVFAPEEILKKQIMNIKTDSNPKNSFQNPNTDLIFTFYKLVANKKEIEKMQKNYISGDYGYSYAKKELYECIIKKFSKERKNFNYYMQNKKLIDNILNKGAEKARQIANITLKRVRLSLGILSKRKLA